MRRHYSSTNLRSSGTAPQEWASKYGRGPSFAIQRWWVGRLDADWGEKRENDGDQERGAAAGAGNGGEALEAVEVTTVTQGGIVWVPKTHVCRVLSAKL